MDDVNRRGFLKATATLAVAAAASSIREPSAPAAEVPAQPPGTATLPQRMLGRMGVSVSILGLGGVGFITEMSDKDAIAALIIEAMDSGINYFDTAASYGKGVSEQNLGMVMRTPRRNGIFLATKTTERSYDKAMREIELSLKHLGTDHLDLIQVHHVWKEDNVKTFGEPGGVLEAMRRLRDQKVVRFIGMSGHPNYPQVKEALEMYDWDTFLCYVNPEVSTRPVFEEQLPVAQRKQMGVIAMKVFGGSTPAKLVGEQAGHAPASLLLRFALGQAITLAIPAVSTREQLHENLRVARELRALSEEERGELMRRFAAGGGKS